MKECDCGFWHIYIGDYFDKTDEDRGTYRLLGEPNTPFYFGVEIHYCPWCGKKLQLIEER